MGVGLDAARGVSEHGAGSLCEEVRMPSPNQFHPEFGYVCPTSRFRRTLCVSAVAAVIGAAAGAVGVFAMAERADRMRSEIVTTIGLADPAAASPSPLPSPGSSAAAASSARDRAVAAMQCPAQPWPYPGNKCGAAGTPASPPPSPTSSTSRATDSAQALAASGDSAAVKPTQQPAAAVPTKKHRNTAQRREPARHEADVRGAVANPNGRYDAAPPPGRQYQAAPYYGDGRYQAAPYGSHYEQQPEQRRGIFW
jgi:hypothetical protein